ncbi:MAG TPA: FAD-dependent monooxygenase [Pirellulales bacterium]|jgi:2-polyprenyl-6-methoxyphenol hydroxylase-like FAD-dependent oxidoreductase|nr:FAD-dependent monooxygenase [Pirellulales bacterium]
MDQRSRPLVVGAGPVGLAVALFVARHSAAPRVIELRHDPSVQSKALAVNPRTLEILEPTGVTGRMLERGLKIHAASLHGAGKTIANISLTGIHARYPFMLALSQATTERLLEEALLAAGGAVERGKKLVECRNSADGVEAVIEPTAGGQREQVDCPWLLAADGAHSAVREQLEIDFPGAAFERPWHLADVPLRTGLPEDHAHIFLLDDGAFLFLIRVVDDWRQEQGQTPLWRIIANRSEPLSLLADAEQAGPVVWASDFRIAHRIASTLAAGKVYFAGDAAHIHSPMGARGMNLGIEDACVFAALERVGRLAEYNALRRPVDERVVRQVERLSRIVAGESAIARLLRRFAFPLAVRIPPVRARMVPTLTGLDHDLPNVVGNPP